MASTPVNPKWVYGGLIGLVGLGACALIALSLVYAGKIYPGVSVNGVYMGGLTRVQAERELQAQTDDYRTKQLPVRYGSTTLRIPISALGLRHQPEALDAAQDFGRKDGIARQLSNRLRALLGRSTSYTSFTYDDAQLATFLARISEDVTRPVSNAYLTFSAGKVAVVSSRPGYRLDNGRLTTAINQALATMQTTPVAAPVYAVTPTINDEALRAAQHQADNYASSSVALHVGNVDQVLDQAKILSWIDVTTEAGRTDLPLDPLNQFYDRLVSPDISLALNQTKVAAYVGELTASIAKTPENAVLAMQDGKLTVTRPSRDGVSLDQAKSVEQIVATLKQNGTDRSLTLTGTVTKAEVNENNLDSLGIKEQLSSGQTFFPGSPSTRLTNVRVGQALYNGILLKPGEIFSFGKILGDVGPAQGYVPELVILADHEEKQYGGGLCQVSSTAYRAALLAGLPILERHNHSFAISYYTAPFGVPGVDATIYYPQVDFKFKNDTPGYILIQTRMQGTTLTFDYFGTKTKYGEIRGPQFISGDSDTTKPSRTVFYRDVKDLGGNLVKTDTVYTNYKSSKDFPIEKQFN